MKEGTCCMYDKTFNITNGTKVNSDSCKSKDLWITDYNLLQNVNKIALGFTTKEIGSSLLLWFSRLFIILHYFKFL